MDRFRKEYKGLGLDDAQIMQAISIKLTPEQVKDIIQNFKNTMREFAKLWEALAKALQCTINNEEFKRVIETLKAAEKMNSNDTLRKKSKPLKTWEKKRFYQ